MIDKDPDLFDAAESRRRRDEGIERVMRGESDFIARFNGVIEHLPGPPNAWEGQCEDIRAMFKAWKWKNPHHSNCWGAIWRAAVAAGMLEWTPKIVNMTDKKSHSRPTHIHRRTGLTWAEAARIKARRKAERAAQRRKGKS